MGTQLFLAAIAASLSSRWGGKGNSAGARLPRGVSEDLSTAKWVEDEEENRCSVEGRGVFKP